MNLPTANKQIIFVDSSVQDYKSLIQGINAAQIFILNENLSGIEQITNALANQKDIEAIHILSHGSEGSSKLGSDVLNGESLEHFSTQIQQWGSSLTENADILLYGCNVGEGSVGKAFLNQLSELTGADIAASDDLTGSAALGGDWDLEVTTGKVESSVVFQPWITKAYTSVLGPNDNFADRITIAGTNINLTGDNIGATGETGESSTWGRNSVWYTWTSPVSGRVVIDTSGNYDTTLAIYTGSAINALTLVTENDDAVGLASRIAFTPTAGTTYQLGIGGFFGRQGSFNLNLNTVALRIGNVSLTEGNSSTINATFTVNLSTISPETVTVNYATANGSATTANNDYQTRSGTLTFNPGITSRTITVPINGDSLFEGDETFTLNLSNPINAGLTTSSATGTIINDDNPGFTVSAISGNTTEAGGTGTFTIQLNTQPTADITLGLTSSNTGEGTVDKTSVTFTSTNWNVAQTVTVTGVNDFVVDGNIAYQIITAADTTTADISYNNLKPADVAVTNTDNDTKGITVNPTSGLTTTEAGGSATFTVVLNSQPTADVSIGMTSDNTAEGNVDKPSLTFTSANWNTPQTVTVTGVDDSVVDGNVAYNIITAAATSTDTNYSGVNASDVAVTNTDNDFPTVNLSVTPTTGTEVGITSITVTATASQAVVGNQTVNVALSGK